MLRCLNGYTAEKQRTQARDETDPVKKNEHSVALSTSEAEYMAASEVGKEIKYLRALLRGAGSAQDQPANAYEDNFACLAKSTSFLSGALYCWLYEADPSATASPDAPHSILLAL